MARLDLRRTPHVRFDQAEAELPPPGDKRLDLLRGYTMPVRWGEKQ
jgi:hypothetical protein